MPSCTECVDFHSTASTAQRMLRRVASQLLQHSVRTQLPCSSCLLQDRRMSLLGTAKEMMGLPGDIPKDVSLSGYADELKKAIRMASVAQFVPGMPSGMGAGDSTAMLKKQEKIARALAARDATNSLTYESYNVIAAETECSPGEIRDVLHNYSLFKAATVRMAELKAEGKPLPKTIQEYTELMQEQRRLNPNGTAGAYTGPPVGKNASCPCGSGKPYKRCCLKK